MSIGTGLAVVFGVGAITYLMRAGLILALAGRTLPAWFMKALRYVAPSVLAALVVSLVADPDQANTGLSLAEVAGLVVAGAVIWRFRNLMVALAAGMTAFWLVLAVV
jgi:branched-subunit amino acid transport protein